MSPFKAIGKSSSPFRSIGESSADNMTDVAVNAGADPKDLAYAKSRLGKYEYIGYCQSFVEQATGSGWQGSTAVDAWQRAKNKVPNIKGVQKGNVLYFSDPNNAAGHTGIYSGDNKFISATDNGVQENNLADWEALTGQSMLGYLPGTQ